ncbi:MAG: cytochrome b/b6 domain-containing protein [Burkholderiales bacterium]
MSAEQAKEGVKAPTVFVWDLALRLFHWLLVVLVVISWTCAQIGGNAMEYHELSGLAILALVLFRILWGFCGGHHARFGNFVRGPRAAWRYLQALRASKAPASVGHNPLGAWSVLAMLVCLSVQAGTGLFSNDDIMMEGPLVKWISKDVSDLVTRIHHANSSVLLALIVLHLAAVLYYLVAKRDNLITPMITGRKQLAGESTNARREVVMVRAAVLCAACAAAVYFLIR